MSEVISASRDTVSDWAPSIFTMQIDREKIGDVIGKGGAVIRAITEETGVEINIEDDGTVKIASVDGESGREARKRIESIVADVEVGQLDGTAEDVSERPAAPRSRVEEIEVGKVYDGTVSSVMDYGAFVTLLPGTDGLVHISQMSERRIERTSDMVKSGDIVKVKVMEVDGRGRIRLTMRGLSDDGGAADGARRARRRRRSNA